MSNYPTSLNESHDDWGDKVFFTDEREEAIRAMMEDSFGQPCEDECNEWDFERETADGGLYSRMAYWTADGRHHKARQYVIVRGPDADGDFSPVRYPRDEDGIEE